MTLPDKAKLLRIFVGEADKVHGKPLYESIVEAAHTQGLAGATVLRGVASFGASRSMHTAKVLRLSEDLPMVIEIVDREEHIAEFLKEVDRLMETCGGGALITLEAAEILRYEPKK